MIFRLEYGKANLTSLVERRSRFTILARNPSRHSAGVMAEIQHHFHILPPSLRQSITFDRGTEFAAFATLQKKLAMTSYFCLPSAPRKRAAWKTATAAYGASCRLTRTWCCYRIRKSRP